ncbi:MAG: hypothetical protein R3F30_04610 [Planctomycetota bacterium]
MLWLSPLLVLCGRTPSQTTQLVKDINTTPVRPYTASQPEISRSVSGLDQMRFVVMGGYAYFTATTFGSGEELWRTDGTTGGTTIVKEINPGYFGSSPRDLTVAGSRIYFQAYDRASGSELWVTDGTATGTRLVADIVPGSKGSAPTSLAVLGSKVVFSADDGKNGRELWITDGTSTGTVLLKDIRPFAGSSDPTQCVADGSGKHVFFRANDGNFGDELWITDGTTSGTRLVKDINTGTSSLPSYIRPLGASRVIFSARDLSAGQELWISDGTAAGTHIVKDIAPGSLRGTDFRLNIPLGSTAAKYVFRGNDGTRGDEWWVTDGTAAGTILLRDVNPGPGAGSASEGCASASGNLAYVSCHDGSAYSIWVTDGTVAGTKPILHARRHRGAPIPPRTMAWGGSASPASTPGPGANPG